MNKSPFFFFFFLNIDRWIKAFIYQQTLHTPVYTGKGLWKLKGKEIVKQSVGTIGGIS